MVGRIIYNKNARYWCQDNEWPCGISKKITFFFPQDDLLINCWFISCILTGNFHFCHDDASFMLCAIISLSKYKIEFHIWGILKPQIYLIIHKNSVSILVLLSAAQEVQVVWFRILIHVNFGDHMETENTVCELNTKFLNVKVYPMFSNHCSVQG